MEAKVKLSQFVEDDLQGIYEENPKVWQAQTF